jgi:hypothetical protein
VRLWVGPLPPDGPVEITIVEPAEFHGTAAVEGASIRAAGRLARTVWSS